MSTSWSAISDLQELSKPDDDFVNPIFNLIIFVVCPLILNYHRHNNGFSWMIDLIAIGYMVTCTVFSTSILQEDLAVQLSDGENYDYLVSSLAWWIAAIILELRTVVITTEKLKYVYDGRHRALEYIKITLVILFAFNSVLVMMWLCLDVSQTVTSRSSDRWLALYYFAASGAKITSTVTQGVFLVFRKYRFPLTNAVDRYFLLRMLLTNIGTILHSIYLTKFGEMYSCRSILLVLDLLFRIALCLWCVYSCLYYERRELDQPALPHDSQNQGSSQEMETEQPNLERRYQTSQESSDESYKSTFNFQEPVECTEKQPVDDNSQLVYECFTSIYTTEKESILRQKALKAQLQAKE